MVSMMCWFNTAAVPTRWTTYASATGKFVLGANANLEDTGGGAGSHNHSTTTTGRYGAAGSDSSHSDDGTTSTSTYTAAYIKLRICYIASEKVRAPQGIILMASGDCPSGWIDVGGTVDRYINVGAADGSENEDTGGLTTGAHTHTISTTQAGPSTAFVNGASSTSAGIGEWIKLRFCEKI